MFEPENSPWGEVQHCYEIGDGIEAYDVSTASHGGVMVPHVFVDRFSPECINIADSFGSYLCWEEDCAASVVIYEMIRLGIYRFPASSYTCSFEEYFEAIKQSVQRWYPEYWAIHGM